MHKIKRFFYWLANDPRALMIFIWMRYGKCIPDKLYLQVLFRLRLGYWMDMRNPKSFAEKLQWLKLHDRQERFHQMVDKYEAKKLIMDAFGAEYVIPTLAVWDSVDDIDINILPNQFILKPTFDSGSYFICKDKHSIDQELMRKKLTIHWNDGYYLPEREWPYKGLPRRIIAEPLIADPKLLIDYKFFCFEGEPRIFQTCEDRNPELGGAILKFYDVEGNVLNIEDKYHTRECLAGIHIPKHLDIMLSIARHFAKGTHFLRMDFYEVNGKVYVGEFTLYENAGFCAFEPDKWDKQFGDWIKLPI